MIICLAMLITFLFTINYPPTAGSGIVLGFLWGAALVAQVWDWTARYRMAGKDGR